MGFSIDLNRSVKGSCNALMDVTLSTSLYTRVNIDADVVVDLGVSSTFAANRSTGTVIGTSVNAKKRCQGEYVKVDMGVGEMRPCMRM